MSGGIFMQKIVPYLWFDHQAEKAAKFYTSLFNQSTIIDTSRYGEAAPDSLEKVQVMSVTFQLEGQTFIALNGGPHFTFTPAISFFVNCDSPEEVDSYWAKLSEGGTALMELGTYPFSEKFGWIQDQFGVSWQVNLGHRKQKITPSLMFVGKQHGKAELAMNDYISLFDNSAIEHIERYGHDAEEMSGTVQHAQFHLAGQEFKAMDSGLDHAFTFNEAISLFVNCETQEEVDTLWDKLPEGGAVQKCGWLKDQYGVSWQIIPTILGELLQDSDLVKSQNVMQAMLQMKKIDIAALKQAYKQ
jgi:predicted 3-demethylubiquinone-9 3-methyltransferase (glyoxalase superfamily)